MAVERFDLFVPNSHTVLTWLYQNVGDALVRFRSIEFKLGFRVMVVIERGRRCEEFKRTWVIDRYSPDRINPDHIKFLKGMKFIDPSTREDAVREMWNSYWLVF